MRPEVRKLGPMCVQTRGAAGELEVAPMPAFTVGGPVKRAPPPPQPAPLVDLPTAVLAPAVLSSCVPKQEQPPASPLATDAPNADASAPTAVRNVEEQREGDDALHAAQSQPESTAQGPAQLEAQPASAAVVLGVDQRNARQACGADRGPAVEAAAVAVASPVACASGASAATADGAQPGHAGGVAAASQGVTPALSQPLQPAEASPAAGDAAASPKAVAQQSARDLPSTTTIGASVPVAAAQLPADGVDVAPQLGAAPAHDAYLATAAATETAPLTSGVSQPSLPDSSVAAGIPDGAHPGTVVSPTMAALVPTASATAHGAPLPTVSASALSAAQPALSPLPAPSGWEGARNGSEMAVAAQRAAFEAALDMALGPSVSTLTHMYPSRAVPSIGAVLQPPAAVPVRLQLPQAMLPPQLPMQQHGAADAVGSIPSDPVAMFLNDGPDK